MVKMFINTTAKKLALAVSIMIIGGLLFFTSFTQTSQASGTISGTVYIDYNMNGVRETTGTAPNLAIDGGLGGVTVTIYAPNGATKSATTSATGTYSIDTAASPALPNGPYRIEFTNLPAGYYPSEIGTNNASTVRFVPNGTSNNNDLGVVVPSNYCQTNPLAIHNVFNVGPEFPIRLSNFHTTTAKNWTADLTVLTRQTGQLRRREQHFSRLTGIATVDEVGATFGLTYNSRVFKLYSAAYLKRGATFGLLSGESTGAIYLTNNPTGNSPTTSTFADLNAIFGAGTAGANPHTTATTTDWTQDTATIPLVGKRSFGRIESFA